MAGSTFGTLFRITTAGESHGPGNVVIVDGVPAGLELTEDDLQVELDRRRPGQSRLVTQRQESDRAEILSGLFEGRTTGTPVAILVRNQDQRSRDYSKIRDVYRPGHADATYDAKYGFRDYRGGGRASARETVSRVAAGAIARKLLRERYGTEIVGFVSQVGEIEWQCDAPETVRREQVEATPVRCPDVATAERMAERIEAARADLDSVGGVATLVATGVPAGIGEPVFDKLKADLAKGLFSLPAVVGVEYGAGFRAARMTGSQHNDELRAAGEGIVSASNRHGGMLGGISSGMPIVMRCAVKPTSSLPREQRTVDRHGAETTVATKGRHDPCVLPRFVPIGEAMVALVLADHCLRQEVQRWERD